MNTRLLFLLSIILLAGCVHETLDPCPTGDVKINIYVEKFQAVTHDYRTNGNNQTHPDREPYTRSK